jgi:hypothetical protein
MDARVFQHAPGGHVVQRKGTHLHRVVVFLQFHDFGVRKGDVRCVAAEPAQCCYAVSYVQVGGCRDGGTEGKDLPDDVVAGSEAWSGCCGMRVPAAALDVVYACDTGDEDTD